MSMMSVEKNEYQNDRDQQTGHEDALAAWSAWNSFLLNRVIF